MNGKNILFNSPWLWVETINWRKDERNIKSKHRQATVYWTLQNTYTKLKKKNLNCMSQINCKSDIVSHRSRWIGWCCIYHVHKTIEKWNFRWKSLFSLFVQRFFSPFVSHAIRIKVFSFYLLQILISIDHNIIKDRINRQIDNTPSETMNNENK